MVFSHICIMLPIDSEKLKFSNAEQLLKIKKSLLKSLKTEKTLTFKKLILSLIFHSFVFYDILENRVCPL